MLVESFYDEHSIQDLLGAQGAITLTIRWVASILAPADLGEHGLALFTINIGAFLLTFVCIWGGHAHVGIMQPASMCLASRSW